MDDWADGHGPGSGHRTPDQIPTSDSDKNEKALESGSDLGVNEAIPDGSLIAHEYCGTEEERMALLAKTGQANLPTPAFHDSDQHKDLDVEAMANILAKTEREPAIPGPGMDAVFPVGVAAVLHSITPMGVPLTQKEQADKARAKELVAELFERIPWEVFMAELDSRGHILKTIKKLREEGKVSEAYRFAHMNTENNARIEGEKIIKFLEAALLLAEGLYVEEGDPDAIKSLINAAISSVHRGGQEASRIYKQLTTDMRKD